jgi:SAM-dependent methyltransferase
MQIIEILPVSLLDEHRHIVDDLYNTARALRLDFGWHYLLDLTWIISHLAPISPRERILDAGAGVGVLQWYLAGLGTEVLSVDRLDRQNLPLRFRGRFYIKGLRQDDLRPVSHVLFNGNSRIKPRLSDLIHGIFGYIQRTPGSITLYHQDLKMLRDIPDDSQDAVVSVSALEHNSPEGLKDVVAELMRVLKPGGKLLATLCAGEHEDWFHEPSKGWCYTADSLRTLFDLPSDIPDNYDQYQALMNDLRDCVELRNGLARFYFQSGNNGMPWGKWDPQYQPVGVCKIKG